MDVDLDADSDADTDVVFKDPAQVLLYHAQLIPLFLLSAANQFYDCIMSDRQTDREFQIFM